MAGIVSVINQVVTVLKTISALKNVPINPPEQMNYETFAVVYPFSGSIDAAPIGVKESLHNIAIDALTVRTDLARNMATVKPFIDSIPVPLLQQVSFDSDGNPGQQFGTTIETFEKLSYSWLETDYGGTPVVGYHFLMENVKVQVNL